MFNENNSELLKRVRNLIKLWWINLLMPGMVWDKHNIEKEIAKAEHY